MKNYIKLIAISYVVALITSCDDWGTRQIYEGYGLGAVTKEFTISSEESTLHIDVISNKEYTISCDADWLVVPSVAPEGREGFTVRAYANDGFPRKCQVKLSIDEASLNDYILIKQEGTVDPILAVESPFITLKGSESGAAEVPVSFNIPESEIEIQEVYVMGVESWMGNLKIQDDKLVFDYSSNDASSRRAAEIALAYVDGWGESYQTKVYVTQLNSTDSEGEDVDFVSLRSYALVSGYTVDQDYILEGRVVSNTANGNAGDNTQIDESTIDYSVSRKTVYLQSLDGKYGLSFETASEEDNRFAQGDRVRINLYGTVLYKSIVTDPVMDPEFYYLKNLKYVNVIEHENGTRSDFPVKEKTMASLTDDDIFTYVTLTDCEIPVRKGSLTPVNEAFTNATDTDMCAKFPILLRDIDGNSMYIYTNTTCGYRKDGSILPYGSGKMSGVIVHEHYTRFEFQDTESTSESTYGNIGRYQIRHTSKEDFAMAPTMQDASFSNILCEWRYVIGQYMEKHDATDGDINAYISSSFKYANTYTDGRAGKLAYTLYKDYSYIGALGQTGNISGLGVILPGGIDWMGAGYIGKNSQSAEKVNAEGNGEVPAGAGSAWCTNITRFNNAEQSMNIVFSTKEINTTGMSIQVAMMNDYYDTSLIPGPRYWHLEYSLDNSNWTRTDTFSVPDYQQLNIPQVWQTVGFKQMDFPLPAAELSDKENVYIRLIPDSQLQAGSKSKYLDPTSQVTKNGSYRTCWNYIGIRYNK